jgi:hypothetical protein
LVVVVVVVVVKLVAVNVWIVLFSNLRQPRPRVVLSFNPSS